MQPRQMPTQQNNCCKTSTSAAGEYKKNKRKHQIAPSKTASRIVNKANGDGKGQSGKTRSNMSKVTNRTSRQRNAAKEEKKNQPNKIYGRMSHERCRVRRTSLGGGRANPETTEVALNHPRPSAPRNTRQHHAEEGCEPTSERRRTIPGPSLQWTWRTEKGKTIQATCVVAAA